MSGADSWRSGVIRLWLGLPISLSGRLRGVLVLEILSQPNHRGWWFGLLRVVAIRD